MDGDLYDEFGNYIGPELESDESEGEEEREEERVSGGRGWEGRVCECKIVSLPDDFLPSVVKSTSGNLPIPFRCL